MAELFFIVCKVIQFILQVVPAAETHITLHRGKASGEYNLTFHLFEILGEWGAQSGHTNCLLTRQLHLKDSFRMGLGACPEDKMMLLWLDTIHHEQAQLDLETDQWSNLHWYNEVINICFV